MARISDPAGRARGGLMAVLTLCLAACGDRPAPVSTPSSAAAAATVTVVSDPATIGAYSPPEVTVGAGDTVEWRWDDLNPHTVTADAGAFGSQTGTRGASFRFTFTSAGTYPYHCAIHPSMHGDVVVH